MDVLVSDTSVVVDLERAQLIERISALPYRFVVPDASREQVLEAQRLRTLGRKISIYDSYALSLAKAEAAILLAGDAAMRRLADSEEVRCHGILWIFDEPESRRVVAAAALHESLTRVTSLEKTKS